MIYDYDYRILNSHSIDQLMKEVKELLAVDWKCQGGVSVAGEYDMVFKKEREIYLQGMVKTKAHATDN